jgi:hypothetical protein
LERRVELEALTFCTTIISGLRKSLYHGVSDPT